MQNFEANVLQTDVFVEGAFVIFVVFFASSYSPHPLNFLAAGSAEAIIIIVLKGAGSHRGR
jgi:hypothetical protein